MSDPRPTDELALSELDARNVFRVQAFMVSGLTLMFYFIDGQAAAQSALYGGAIVLFNGWITQRRLRAAQELAKIAPGREVTTLYLAAIQRFIFTLIFFALGMGWLELDPIPMLITFGLAQLGYFISGFMRTKT